MELKLRWEFDSHAAGPQATDNNCSSLKLISCFNICPGLGVVSQWTLCLLSQETETDDQRTEAQRATSYELICIPYSTMAKLRAQLKLIDFLTLIAKSLRPPHELKCDTS